MRNVFIEMEKLNNPASGLGQFCLNIGEQFQKIDLQQLKLDFYIPISKKNIFGKHFNYINKNSLHKFFPLNSSKYNVWHCVHQDSKYMPNNKNTKLILTIHDLNFLEKYTGAKQKSKLKKLQKKIDRASAITVISKFTEIIVKEHLDVNVPVHIIYNGNSLKESKQIPTIELATFGEYFFSIGIISEKKNFHVLLSLLEYFKEKHLVIAGNNNSDYAKQIIALAKAKGIYERLHLIGNVDDNNKYHLYKKCNAFVFPSLTEGFGLPVIEAMSLGKPVFLSTLSSLPEIGGKEAYYWNNFESKKMAEIVEKGLKDFSSDVKKAERTIAWTKQFSWENAAKAYLNLYENI